MLRAALTQAVRWGWVESHPVALASAPSLHRPQAHPYCGRRRRRAMPAAHQEVEPRAARCSPPGPIEGPRQRDDPACRRPPPAVGARSLWLQGETAAWSRPRPPSWFGDRSLRSHVSKTSRTPRPTRQAGQWLDEATTAALRAHRDVSASLAARADGPLWRTTTCLGTRPALSCRCRRTGSSRVGTPLRVYVGKHVLDCRGRPACGALDLVE